MEDTNKNHAEINKTIRDMNAQHGKNQGLQKDTKQKSSKLKILL